MNTKKLVSTIAFAALSTLSAASYAGSAVLNGFSILGDGSAGNAYDMGALPVFPSYDLLSVTLTGNSGDFFLESTNFTAPPLSTGLGAATTYSIITGGLQILGMHVDVWDNVHPGGTSLIASFGGDNLIHSFSLVAGGQYHFDVSGTLNGIQAQYSVAMALAPIPEPETYAMLIAGLGLMGFVARRRQRKLAA